MLVRVETGARLHMGFVDLHGGLGRRFGSLGVGLKKPQLILEATPAAELTSEGPGAKRALGFARRFYEAFSPRAGKAPPAAHIRVVQTIPPHVGLGSGTQLALGIGVALARLSGVEAQVSDLAVALGRGRRSRIGIGSFEVGGFIVDGGRRVDGETLPPIILRRTLPPDWLFVVVTPHVEPGLSGQVEDQAFDDLARPSEERAGQIARLLMMRMLPTLIENDIEQFGAAVTEVQRLVGDSFAPVQGGRYANRTSGRLIEDLLRLGAVGAGQSSWGPTVYGLVRGDSAARALKRQLEDRPYGERLTVHVSEASDQGARVTELRC